MSMWLTTCLELNEPCVLVTVAAVDGSGPRETGAKMIVTAAAQADTIGGGHLEMRACEIAREMLAVNARPARRLERFALGPALGQCCGGVVYLAFELLDQAARSDLQNLRQRQDQRSDTWRLIALDEDLPTLLFTREGKSVHANDAALPMDIQFERPCHIMRNAAGKRWLIDPCLAYRPHLVLFGAGHVGAAIVRALAELPCHVTWVDEREDLFPAELPSNVAMEATDTPEAVADHAPAGSTFLVLTHSHALDQRLTEHILRRPGNDWFGLIGSRTKRMQFEHRLTERGIARAKLDAMVCPIGMPGITGKEPSVIAAAVAAQLLQVWEAQQRAIPLDAQPLQPSVIRVSAA